MDPLKLCDVLVLGGGSAGLIAALTLQRHIPNLRVRLVRSPDIGIIGVGESTTPNVPFHFFQYLGLDPRRFYALVQPTWKMGIHFIWGPRESFNYAFEPQLDVRAPELPRPNGYYCDDVFDSMCLQSALMAQCKAFPRQASDGGPEIPSWHAFHLDNPRLVAALEVFAKERGIEVLDGKMASVERGPQGVAAIHLDDGRRMAADFFVDASGFRSALLEQSLGEPYISYSPSLFNDRAMVGSWHRTDEPILPYTTAETMNSGWCWRIDHETEINRGYVYSSQAISDDDAREELQAKNPKIKIRDRIIQFRTGRHARAWVGNVMAIGNAAGFVEPLESTGLMMICWQCQTFVEMFQYAGDTPGMRSLFNQVWAETWDEIRDFLTFHFWANSRLQTPYWEHCRHDTDISRVTSLLDFYRENGPTGYSRYRLNSNCTQFGIEGFLVMLVGNRVPYRNRHTPTDAEWQVINSRRNQFKSVAAQGLDVREALAYIRHPQWRWFSEGS